MLIAPLRSDVVGALDLRDARRPLFDQLFVPVAGVSAS